MYEVKKMKSNIIYSLRIPEELHEQLKKQADKEKRRKNKIDIYKKS